MSESIIVLWWWILAAALGALAWPMAFRLLRCVPDRGYSAARPLGLLLGACLWWMAGSLGFLTTSTGSIIIALALAGALSIWFYRAQASNDRDTLANWLRENRLYALAYELVFLAAFAAWAYFRAHSPGINHTEKPMEFAFLNSILRSPGFPPNDPWLSGHSISYYYMGYVMMALLTRLSGTAPGIAYNAAHALWFALFATGAFGAAYNLVSASEPADKEQTISKPRAIVYGLLAAVMLLVMGNLGGALELAHQNSVGSPVFWKWLDIADLDGPATSGGGLTAQRGGWWWWRASRVINDYTLDGSSQHRGGTTVIDEFPLFSFILGDMHPHVLGLPFSLLAIMLALDLYRSHFKFKISNFKLTRANHRPTTDDPPSTSHFPLSTFFLYALIIGSLGFLNTWDFPLYLALTVAAYGLRRWQEEGRLDQSIILEAGLLGVSMGVVGYVLYLPFYLTLELQPRGVFPNLFFGTRFSQLFVMFGPLLVIGACFLLALARRARLNVWRAIGWTAVILVACVILILAIGIISPEGRTYLRAWLQAEPLPGLSANAGPVVISRLAGRLLGTSTLTPRADGTTITVPGSGPWTPLIFTLTIVIIVLLWREHVQSMSQSVTQPTGASRPVIAACSASASPCPPISLSPCHFVLLLYATGAAIVLALEFVFLGDAFGGTRMNTIFKFYYQVWALWSVASAYGAYYVIDSVENKQGYILRMAQAALIAIMILAGLIYPLMAIPSRADSNAPLTLDGTAYLAHEAPDEYAAIQWLNANVPGAPVILEAPGGSFRAETSRVSGYTGLPTLLGWDGHEAQWRKNFTQGASRSQAIADIYNSRDVEQTLALLNQYNIGYIYVGGREKAQYSPFGLAKFDTIADVVFRLGNVTIYKVRR